MKKAVVICCVLIAASCIQPIQERFPEPGPGVLQLTLDGSAARTALPSPYAVNSLYYTLAFTPASGAGTVYHSIAIGSASGEFPLDAGTWSLEVKGFRSPGDALNPANALVAGSQTGIVISAAAGTAVHVRLVPDETKLTQVSTGTLGYTVGFPWLSYPVGLPWNVEGATLTIYNAATNLEFTSIDLLASNPGTLELASGVYNLNITLHSGGGGIAVKGLTAHIYDGLTTWIHEDFTAGHFAAAGEITAFSLGNGTDTFEGHIDQDACSIVVFVLPATDISALTAAIEHTGLLISSDPAAPNFTGPVSYTVSREDGTSKTYTVEVSNNGAGSVAGLAAFLAAYEANTEASPIPVKLKFINLSLADGGWAAILSAIEAAGKYVDLDLSGCTMWSTEFDPGSADTGERYITGLVLPNGARGIKSINIDGYVFPTFRYFTKLKTLSAFGVVDVVRYAFSGCDSLTEVSLPEAAAIGDYAFNSCTGLTEVSLPEAATIGYDAFYGCTGLTEVSLPEATTIGYHAFNSCTGLTEVSLPEAATIGIYAFWGCTGLTTVSLPKAATIGNSAFYFCSSLTAVSLGATAPKVGTNMFYGGSSQTVTVKVPYGATGYGTIPATYSGSDSSPNWGNAFRGLGWDGTNYSGGYVNSSITLNIEYE
jgi:hypothetical protein